MSADVCMRVNCLSENSKLKLIVKSKFLPKCDFGYLNVHCLIPCHCDGQMELVFLFGNEVR